MEKKGPHWGDRPMRRLSCESRIFFFKFLTLFCAPVNFSSQGLVSEVLS